MSPEPAGAIGAASSPLEHPINSVRHITVNTVVYQFWFECKLLDDRWFVVMMIRV
jgi:hypothetical protein